MKPFYKEYRATKKEKRDLGDDSFSLDVQGDFVFIYGGGLEGCVPHRVFKLMIAAYQKQEEKSVPKIKI